MSDDRPVGVELTANNSQYDAAMQQSTQQTMGLGDAVSSLSERLGNLTRSTGRGLQIIGAADIALLGGAAAAAGSFEQQMAGLQAQGQALNKTLAAGDRQFESYRSSVNRLRNEFPTTTREAAQLVATVSRMGDGSAAVDKVTASFQKLSGATGESSAALSANVLQLTRQLGEGTSEVGKYNNAILKMSATTGSSAQGITTFAAALGPAGRQLNIAGRDIIGISGAFTKAGQDGQLAANTFNQMANQISTAIQENSPVLKAYADLLGMTTQQFKNSDQGENIVRIFDALSAQGPAAIRTLQSLGFEGQRNIRAIQAVTQQGNLQGLIAQSRGAFNENKNNELERASQKAYDGLNDQVIKLRESMKKNAEAVGAPFAVLASKYVQGLTQMSQVTGALISGPLGMLGQILAGIAGPLALVSGTAMRFVTPLLTLASIKGFGGAGMAGFLGARGGNGPMTRTMSAAYDNKELGPVRRRMFEGGQTLANLMTGAGFSRDRRRYPDFDDDQIQAIRDARPKNSIKRFFSRAAGETMGLGAATADLLLSPIDVIGGGYSDPRKRGKVAEDYLTSRGRGLKDLFLANAPSFGGRGAGYQRAREDALTHTAFRAGDKTFEETLKATKLLGAETGKTAGIMRNAGNILMTFAGAGLGAGRLTGAGIGSFLGVPGPLALGALGLGGATLAYDKWLKPRDNSGTYESMGSGLSSYIQASGATGTTPYDPSAWKKNLKAAAAPKTLGEALQITPEATRYAKSGGFQYTDKRVKSMSTREQALQMLAPQFSAMETIPPGMLGSIRNDLIARFGEGDAAWVVRQLQSPDLSLPGYGNLAGNVKFSPQDVIGDSGKGNQFWDMGDFTKQSKSAKQVRRVIADRADASANRFGGAAYDPQKRQDWAKALGGADDVSVKQRMKLYEQYERDNGLDMEYNTGFWDTLTTAFKYGPEAAIEKTRPESSDPKKQLETLLRRLAKDPKSKSRQFFQSTGFTSTAGLEGDALDKVIKENEVKRAARENENSAAGLQVNGEKWRGIVETFTKQGRAAEGVTLANRLYGDRRGEGGQTLNVDPKIAAFQGGTKLQQMGAAAAQSRTYLAQNGGNTEQAIANLRGDRAYVGLDDPARRNALQATLAVLQQQQGLERSNMAPVQQLKAQIGDYNTLAATKGKARQDSEFPAELEAAQTTAMSAYAQLQGLQLQVGRQWRDFGISQAEQLFQYNQTRQRSEEDFALSRDRAEEDFNRSRERAQDDYNLQRKYAQEDFTLGRLRQEQDFNHQVELMAEQSAKSLYNIYQRVDVQRTISGSNLLANGGDQLQRMTQQNQNLDKVRGLGLSDDAIQQLGLTDSANSQQLNRLVGELQNDPEKVQAFNKQIQERIKQAKKLVTDDSSSEWQEMSRSYNLARDRAQEDFDKAQKRSRKAFDLSLDRQRDDFGRSMDRQEDDFDKSMKRMGKDFEHSRGVAADAMQRSIDDLNGGSEKLIKLGAEKMGEAAVVSLEKIGKSMDDAAIKANKGLAKSAKETLKIVALINAAFGSMTGSSKSSDFVTGAQSNLDNLVKSWGGKGGEEHTHGPGCGHGGMGGAEYNYPVSPHPITSGFGWRTDPISHKKSFHDGVDFGGSMGEDYFAPAAGTVREIKNTAWGGRVPYIDHGGGITTFYGHSSGLSVHPGQHVAAGDKIGDIGSTGRSTGPHLHFGAYKNGKLINPLGLLNGKIQYSSGPGMSSSGASFTKQKLYSSVENPLKSINGLMGIKYQSGAMSDRINAAADHMGAGGEEFAMGGGGLVNNAVGSIPVISNIVNHYAVDKSSVFTGQINVQANDPNEFMRQVEAKKRQDALLNPTLAGR